MPKAQVQLYLVIITRFIGVFTFDDLPDARLQYSVLMARIQGRAVHTEKLATPI